jgi:hypothetical protein
MPRTEQQKLRARIRRYERALAKEKRESGWYDDGGGKRYLIGPLYMLLGDDEGALAAFEWFEREFDDDAGLPEHRLCWSLALHRSGDEHGAARQRRRAMLSNLYLLPHLFGEPIAELDIWHGSDWEEPGHVDEIDPRYLALWNEEDRAWAADLYESPGFRSVRERYIEIEQLLDSIPPGPERSRLVDEAFDLKYR